MAAWAARLQPALEAAGGLLRSDGELHAVASDLTASLGDRYTEFLPPSAYRLALRRPTAGELAYATAQAGGGVGIVVDGPAEGVSGGFLHHPSRARGARVAAVAAESAAEAAGVRAGDALLEVDRYAVDRLPDSAVAALLRGPAGADVAVTIAPFDGAPPRRLTLERRPLPQPPVKAATLATRGGRSVAYLRLHYVSGDATAAMASALAHVETEHVDGIVLDLRNNPGGMFEEGVATAALLLPDGAPIASFDRGGGGRRRRRVDDPVCGWARERRWQPCCCRHPCRPHRRHPRPPRHPGQPGHRVRSRVGGRRARGLPPPRHPAGGALLWQGRRPVLLSVAGDGDTIIITINHWWWRRARDCWRVHDTARAPAHRRPRPHPRRPVRGHAIGSGDSRSRTGRVRGGWAGRSGQGGGEVVVMEREREKTFAFFHTHTHDPKTFTVVQKHTLPEFVIEFCNTTKICTSR